MYVGGNYYDDSRVAGIGTFNQTGGTTKVSGNLIIGNAGGTGTYYLSGASSQLTVTGEEWVGSWGRGTFNQMGGTHTVNGALVIGEVAREDGGVMKRGVGDYNMSAGNLNVTSELVVGKDGTGTFNQTGGTVVIAPGGIKLLVGGTTGSTGNYNLSGAGSSVSAPVIVVGAVGNGSFTQGGTTQVITTTLALGYNTGGSGAYTLNDGALTAAYERVGMAGTGTFVQNGGVNTVTTRLDISQAVGTTSSYQMSGGTLHAERVWIGPAGTGNFNQGLGTVTVNSDLVLGGVLYSGVPQPGVGTYNLNGGDLKVKGNLVVGNFGKGTFTQRGGTVTVDNFLILGQNTGSSGNYTLYNGTLNVGILVLANRANFTLAGGRLNIRGQATNTGTLNNLSIAGNVTNQGTISGTTSISGSVTNNGVVTGAVTIRGDVTNNSGGVLGGTTIVAGNLLNFGIINPGNSPGMMSVSGDYDQDPSGTLLMELAGYGRGISYDFLDISGEANLNGRLEVDFLSQFMAKVGDSFDLLHADGGFSGRFSLLDLPTLASGRWFLDYSDPNDLWLRVLDNGPETVPEPSTLILLGAGMVGLFLVKRKKR
jgi:hypothetical protein